MALFTFSYFIQKMLTRMLLFISLFIFQAASSQNMQKPVHTFLALGDSYTVGESLPEEESFPFQTIKLLRDAGVNFESPELAATTGWTTTELKQGISDRRIEKPFSFVSLLIGVNDQYRGGKPKEYAFHFEQLLRSAIEYADKKNARVFVLSIPDWGVTPFAEGRNRELIGREIDHFNMINKSIAERYNVNYIEITTGTRESANDSSLIAADGLHPSAKEYKRWAVKLAQAIQQQLR